MYKVVHINYKKKINDRELNNNSANGIDDWAIVYAPQNPHFEELVDGASQLLGLDPGQGVNSPEELEIALINQRFLVGLHFHHDHVTEVGINKLDFNSSVTSKPF